MYHDSNTLMMVMKLERQLNENQQALARLRKDCLRPGTYSFSQMLRCAAARIRKPKLWSRQAETA